MEWVLLAALAAALAFLFARWRRRSAELGRASEARQAAVMAEAMVAAKPPDPGIAQQRLLLEAAAKAAEAGEPVLSIQLYARLISRYPEGPFAEQARAAAQAQKKTLAKT